jgi:N-acetyl-gamma-glutamyl-phosphate reductase common form
VTSSAIPVAILGGSGYVGGELLRLLALHPVLRPALVLSESQAGKRVADVFPHVAGTYDLSSGPDQQTDLTFASPAALADLCTREPRLAIFSALQHGQSAPQVAAALAVAEAAGCDAHVVDLSADFRFADAGAYAAVYGHAHPSPERLTSFTCGLPEHVAGTPTPHVGHPGCFVTSVLLPLVALLHLGLIEKRCFVSAITGSTGAGRTPTPRTHHPERRSTIYAYSPLGHRHQPEMTALALAASGQHAEIHFVPHSGPHARGIYATLHCTLRQPTDAAEVRDALRGFYAGSPFVAIGDEPPRMHDVVGTNRCHLGVAVEGTTLAVFSTLDNLVKGAAGGGIQWMNRLFDLDEAMGLRLPGLGWL